MRKVKSLCQLCYSFLEKDNNVVDKLLFKDGTNAPILSSSFVNNKKNNAAKPTRKKDDDIVNDVKEMPKNEMRHL